MKLVLHWILWLFFLLGSGYAADLVKARDALERDDYSTALAIAKEACNETPDNAEAWIVLGHALSGQIDEASVFKKADLAKSTLAAYRRAAVLAPTNVEAHVSLLEYYRQAPAIVGGSRAKARDEAKLLVGLDPAVGYSWLARLAGEDKRIDDAFSACEALFRLEPKSYRALYWFGATCAISGQQLSKGEVALREALQSHPGADDPGLDEADVQLGHLLEKKGETAAAISAYKAALTLNSKSREARLRLEQLK